MTSATSFGLTQCTRDRTSGLPRVFFGGGACKRHLVGGERTQLATSPFSSASVIPVPARPA